jgi:chemotaxis methyl-accepting protein methylase
VFVTGRAHHMGRTIRRPFGSQKKKSGPESTYIPTCGVPMDDASFHQILDHFNLSRKGYRKVRKGVKKRLSQHMQKLGCVSVGEYMATVSRAPDIENECRMHLTVSISRFFRDNLLTYYRTPEKEKALDTILRALASGGMLITGSHVKLPAGFGHMKVSADQPWIFFKPQTAQGVM